MEALRGRGSIAPTLFLTSALDGSEWSVSYRLHFTPGKRIHSTHCTGSWVGPIADLDKARRKNPIHQGSNPSSSPYSDTILTELPGFHAHITLHKLRGTFALYLNIS
jgi:hypothetical protein